MSQKNIDAEVSKFVIEFLDKHGSLIAKVGRKYLIPNRYTIDDIKQYISERIIKILGTRLAENTNPIENPEKYFKSCLDFYCIEFQRMHGYIFDLPKRPRKNCVEDEKAAKAWGFKYLGDITIEEYNSLYEYTVDNSIAQAEAKLTSNVWDVLTGVLTSAEADVISCIYYRKMTWNETSEYLKVAQSTCWFRKNKHMRSIRLDYIMFVSQCHL